MDYKPILSAITVIVVGLHTGWKLISQCLLTANVFTNKVFASTSLLAFYVKFSPNFKVLYWNQEETWFCFQEAIVIANRYGLGCFLFLFS